MLTNGSRHDAGSRGSRLGFSAEQVVFLDATRALAAASVMLHHILLLSGHPTDLPLGSLGVTTFFLLSGLLIDRSAQRQAARGGGLRDFILDWAARIYVCFVPALLFTAAVVAQLSRRSDFVGEPHYGVWQLIGNLLMLQNYPAFQIARRIGFDASWFVRPYALGEPYWTVPIELHLYIAFGALYFVGIKHQPWPSVVLRVVAALSVLPVLYHAATGYGQCLTWLWLLGVLGSRILQARVVSPRPGIIGCLLATAAALLLLRMASRTGEFFDLQNGLFLGMVLLAGLWASPHLRWLNRAYVRRPAKFFAELSYPLYVTHNVVIGWSIMRFGRDWAWLQCLGVALGCQAVAFAFYWAFDRHYKLVARWLRHFGAPAPAAAAPVATE